MNYLLLYHQQLQANSKLIEGRLLLIDTDRFSVKNTYIATSGLANYQASSSMSVRGRGPIPSTSVTKLDHYKVLTAPIPMPNLPGVEGNFYKVNPHMVNVEGVERGDFGIHFDANVPGSAGCIVLRTQIGWDAFQADVKSLKSQGLKELPLIVSYAR